MTEVLRAKRLPAERVTLAIPGDVAIALRAFARGRGLSFSDAVVRALRLATSIKQVRRLLKPTRITKGELDVPASHETTTIAVI